MSSRRQRKRRPRRGRRAGRTRATARRREWLPAAQHTTMDIFHGTTILSVRRGAKVALGGDGQVTLGNVVIKAT
ncbi:MAG: hypothetical protein ACREX7_06700, partial [Casimicrobiaceae bacterium]